MTGPVLMTAETAAGVKEIEGWPTGVPGLLVAKAAMCGGRWSVSHARSGTRFPFCLPDPEAALSLALALDGVADWRQPFEAVRAAQKTAAYRAAIVPYVPSVCRHAGGQTAHPRDNGVIA
jgi:hypothetical protein